MISEEHLSSFPVKNGIRQRGKGMTRLETFVDASFAFALTLLVISFDSIPGNIDELIVALKGIPAFAMCFAIIIMPWVGHRQWSQNFGLEEGASMITSFILVFVILVYVFPLRIMMGVAFENMTGGWLQSQFVLESIEETRLLIIIYGVGFAAACFCLIMLNYQALRLTTELQLNIVEELSTKLIIGGWLIVSGTALLSIVLAVTVPGRFIGFAGGCYFILSIIMPVYSIFASKKLRQMGAI
tara:strand:- start:9923 stop:10648 length:726 start_codon:yes stop_codon:yes gene_type:complete